MREIRFRAWNFESKVMLDHDFITETIIQDGEIVRDFSDVLNGKDTFILMQYTGLNDKNGVEIYEGDIVEDDILGISLYVIKFVKGRFTMVDSEDETGSLWILSEKCKVVGNIHDNPELLEVAK